MESLGGGVVQFGLTISKKRNYKSVSSLAERGVCLFCLFLIASGLGTVVLKGRRRRFACINTWPVHNNWRTHTRGHTTGGGATFNPRPEPSGANTTNTAARFCLDCAHPMSKQNCCPLPDVHIYRKLVAFNAQLAPF